MIEPLMPILKISGGKSNLIPNAPNIYSLSTGWDVSQRPLEKVNKI